MNLYFSMVTIAVSLFFGWYSHTVYDGYRGEKAAVATAKSLAVGQTKIVHDTQTITKVITKYVKTSPCLTQPVPTDVLKQLQ